MVLDGEDVGVAPLDAPILVDLGTHQMRVTKADFKPIEESVEATGGQNARRDHRAGSRRSSR